jgi:hypothetical protein
MRHRFGARSLAGQSHRARISFQMEDIVVVRETTAASDRRSMAGGPVARSCLLWTLAFFLGCGAVIGPESMPVASVKGVVTEGQRPVGGGWIEFIPVGGTVGKLRSARLAANGTFDAMGVAVGVNLVRVVHASIESPAIARVVSDFASPIRRVVSREGGQFLTIDLLEETVRFQASLSSEKEGRIPAAVKGRP